MCACGVSRRKRILNNEATEATKGTKKVQHISASSKHPDQSGGGPFLAVGRFHADRSIRHERHYAADHRMRNASPRSGGTLKEGGIKRLGDPFVRLRSLRCFVFEIRCLCTPS